MTSYLKALTKYPGSGMLTVEDVRPIQPSTRPLNAKRDVIDGRGQNPSEEIGEGDEHHPNDLNTTPVSNLLSLRKPRSLDSAVNHGLMNEGTECIEACGRQSGFCPTFCGTGLCCRSGKVRNGCDGRMGKKDTYVCVRSPISAPSEGNPAIDHEIPIKPELAPHTEALSQALHT